MGSLLRELEFYDGDTTRCFSSTTTIATVVVFIVIRKTCTNTRYLAFQRTTKWRCRTSGYLRYLFSFFSAIVAWATARTKCSGAGVMGYVAAVFTAITILRVFRGLHAWRANRGSLPIPRRTRERRPARSSWYSRRSPTNPRVAPLSARHVYAFFFSPPSGVL